MWPTAKSLINDSEPTVGTALVQRVRKLAIETPSTFGPISFQVKTQKCTSDSTAESELASLNNGVKKAGLPALDLWEVLLDRELVLKAKEDNDAAIKSVEKGYSPSMRFLHRTQKVKLGFLNEIFSGDQADLEHCPSEFMRADPLTKSISPEQWGLALAQLGILKFSSIPNQ